MPFPNYIERFNRLAEYDICNLTLAQRAEVDQFYKDLFSVSQIEICGLAKHRDPKKGKTLLHVLAGFPCGEQFTKQQLLQILIVLCQPRFQLVNVKSQSSDYLPLPYAAMTNNAAFIEAFITALRLYPGQKYNLEEGIPRNNNNALHIAVDGYCKEAIFALMAEGFDSTKKNSYQRTPEEHVATVPDCQRRLSLLRVFENGRRFCRLKNEVAEQINDISQLQGLISQLESALAKEIAKSAELTSLHAQISELRSGVDHLQREAAQQANEVARITAEYKGSVQTAEKLQENIDDLEARLAAVVSQKRTDSDLFRVKFEHLRNNFQKMLDAKDKELEALRQSKNSLEKEFATSRAQQQALQARPAQLTAEVSRLQQEQLRSQKTIRELQHKLAAQQEEARRTSASLQDKHAQDQQLIQEQQQQLMNAGKQHEQDQTTINRLQAEIESMSRLPTNGVMSQQSASQLAQPQLQQQPFRIYCPIPQRPVVFNNVPRRIPLSYEGLPSPARWPGYAQASQGVPLPYAGSSLLPETPPFYYPASQSLPSVGEPFPTVRSSQEALPSLATILGDVLADSRGRSDHPAKRYRYALTRPQFE